MKKSNKIRCFNLLATFILLVSQFTGLPIEVFAARSEAAKQSMEVTDEVLTKSIPQYDTYYHSKEIDYLYKGEGVVSFPTTEQVVVGDKQYELKNQETDVTIQQQDGNISISLSNLTVPVDQIPGDWNTAFGGLSEIVYDTDIPGLAEVRTGSLTNPIQLTDVADGEYHLTNGQIFEKANEWSPGFDFNDGAGVVTERYFGTLPDITVVVGKREAEQPTEPTEPTEPAAYLGVKTKAEIYEDFENDIWLQYQQKELAVGESVNLRPWRVEQIVSDAINNDVQRPTFNFELISGDSISLSEASSTEKSIVKAEKAGTSIVKVTYDATEYKGKLWGANSPVNTGYVVFTVAETGQATIELNDELKNWRHYDTIYYSEGETIPFDFTAKAAEAQSLRVLVNGLEIEGDAHQYTAELENRSNIISVEATDKDGKVSSLHRVVDARFIEVNVDNKTAEGKKITVGDKAKVSFKGITMPVYKLATIYNPTMNAWGGQGTYVGYENAELGQFKGKAGQWDLATKNSFDVSFEKAGTYKFTSPKGIFSSWWGSPLGSDITAGGSGAPNLNAPVLEDVFSKMPDFSIEVTEKSGLESIKLNKEKLSLEAGETEQLSATVTPESESHRLVWSSNDDEKATVDQAGKITTFKPGKVIITAAIDDMKATTELTITGEAVFIPVTDVKLTFEQLGTNFGETIGLNYTIVPDNATDKTAVFTSDDETIAKVSSEGQVTGVTPGTTNVHIQVGDIKKTWEVSFSRAAAATKVANEISALPALEKLTLDHEQDVINARKAYDALSNTSLKKQVENLAKLEAAEAKIKELKEVVIPEPEYSETLTFTIERFTIGQGFFQEPVRVAFAKGERVSEILNRYIEQNNHEYVYGGTLQNMFYLRSIKHADTGKVIVPAYITEQLAGPSTEDALDFGNDDEYLGEFDYASGSGWMYFANDKAPDVGMADYFAKNEDVVRLQYTLLYGMDLSVSDFSRTADQLVFSNKDEGLKELARFNAREEKETLLARADVAKAFDNLMLNVQNAIIPQEQLDLSISQFKKTLETPTEVDIESQKAAAIEQLTSYKQLADYREAEQAVLTELIADATQLITNATSETAMTEVLKTALETLDAVKNNAQLIEEETEAADKDLAESKEAAAAKLDEYNRDDYREAEKKVIDDSVTAGKKAIVLATSKADVAEVLKATLTKLAAVKTDAQLTDEEAAVVVSELAEAKAEATIQLNRYKPDNYRKSEQVEVVKGVQVAKQEIETAGSKEDVAAILKVALAKLEAIKTADQWTAEEEAALAKELETVKADAKGELAKYKLENYRKGEQVLVEEHLEAAKQDIKTASSSEDVTAILKAAIAKLERIKTADQWAVEEAGIGKELLKLKEEAIANISTYKKAAAYRENEQKELNRLVVATTAKINKAQTKAEITTVVKEATAALDLIKTDLQLTEDEAVTEALVTLKVTAIAELSDEIQLADYRENEQKLLNEIVAEATTAIKAAKTKAEIDSIVKEAREQVEEIKTDAQLTKEEADATDLAKLKETAITELHNYEKDKNFSGSEQKESEILITEATKNINAAEDKETIDEIVKETKAELDKVQTQTVPNKTIVNRGTSTPVSNKRLPQAGEAADKALQLLRLLGISILLVVSLVVYRRKQFAD